MVASFAKSLQVLDPMHNFRVECPLGYWLDVVRLKVLPTATLGTLPPIPFKHQKAIAGKGFIIVLGCNQLYIWCIYHWIVFAFDAGNMVSVDVWVPDRSVFPDELVIQ